MTRFLNLDSRYQINSFGEGETSWTIFSTINPNCPLTLIPNINYTGLSTPSNGRNLNILLRQKKSIQLDKKLNLYRDCELLISSWKIKKMARDKDETGREEEKVTVEVNYAGTKVSQRYLGIHFLLKLRQPCILIAQMNELTRQPLVGVQSCGVDV